MPFLLHNCKAFTVLDLQTIGRLVNEFYSCQHHLFSLSPRIETCCHDLSTYKSCQVNLMYKHEKGKNTVLVILGKQDDSGFCSRIFQEKTLPLGRYTVCPLHLQKTPCLHKS